MSASSFVLVFVLALNVCFTDAFSINVGGRSELWNVRRFCVQQSRISLRPSRGPLLRGLQLQMAEDDAEEEEKIEQLRTCFNPPWACMAKCGACCYLAPEERDLSGLSEQEKELYLSMVSPDGWCIHFDKEKKLCGVYEDRPSFCRIERFSTLYGLEEDDLGDSAADSCREHIAHVYGEWSSEMEKFDELQDSVREAAGWVLIADDGEEEPELELAALPLEERIERLETARLSLVAAVESSGGPEGGSEEPARKQEMLEAIQTLEEAIAALRSEQA